MSFESVPSARGARISASARRIACAAVGAASLSLLAVGVQAKDEYVADAIRVNYSDLDLSNKQDAQKLYARLRNASTRVCGWSDVRDVRMRLAHQVCYDTALAEAVADVDHAALTQLHDTETRIRIARSE